LIYLDKKYKKFTCDKDIEITSDLIEEAILMHQIELVPHYVENEDMYLTDHPILHREDRPDYKPDNRMVVNTAKYIVDTFEGYRMGNPIKLSHDNKSVDDFINEFRQSNDMQDKEPEVSKDTSIFGHSFLYVFQRETGETGVAYESPIYMFIVYDDTIEENPLFAVRYALDGYSGIRFGEVITVDEIIKIEPNDDLIVHLGESKSHIYDYLPVIEVTSNEERQGLFDSVKTLINGLNDAISAKADDVQYFAEAYLKITGVEMDDDDGEMIGESRILNLFTYDDKRTVDAEFMQKPSADETQENLIDHLWSMIFTISMVANISDENFGSNESGIAMAYKMQAMSNLAKVKDRKFESALDDLYRVVFCVPNNQVKPDDYKQIEYTFTRNVPKNVKEEAEIVEMLDMHVTDETKLSVLSILDNAKAEIDKMEKQEKERSLPPQRRPDEESEDDEEVDDVETRRVLDEETE
jgi:SPP1 family phage portal protein